MFQPKARVRILSYVGATFEPCWKEQGTICKPKAGQGVPSAEWFLVKFDDGGGMLCVHQSRLMPSNQ